MSVSDKQYKGDEHTNTFRRRRVILILLRSALLGFLDVWCIKNRSDMTERLLGGRCSGFMVSTYKPSIFMRGDGLDGSRVIRLAKVSAVGTSRHGAAAKVKENYEW